MSSMISTSRPEMSSARSSFSFTWPELSDPVKAVYRKTATPRDWLAYGQAWASQMIRHPGCYLSATIIQNALLFDVNTKEPRRVPTIRGLFPA